MTNPFYDAGPQRPLQVHRLFAAIARRYDLINDLQSFGLHRRWKQRLVRSVTLSGRARVLDLCCGTGDIAFALAREGVRVVGADFCLPMLRVARERSHADWLARNGLVGADASRLPFPDASFDLITISYGLRNLAVPEAGLAEMWRVLKPRGGLRILDFGKPANRAWRAVYFGYLRRVVPGLGRLLCGSRDAYAYIAESLDHYPDAAGVVAWLVAANYVEVRVVNLLGGIMSIHAAEKPGLEGR
jgi:demethylmenaquinone methyltransferase / 2-methoxy-6-polyprenyl-1,4-benzoquinol methylase